MTSQEQQIINHLKESNLGKWVSTYFAVWDCDTPGCFTSLENLVKHGIIEKKRMGNRVYVRYNKPSTPKLELIK